MLPFAVVPLREGDEAHQLQRLCEPRVDPLQQRRQRALHPLDGRRWVTHRFTASPGAGFMNRRRLCQLTAAILTSDLTTHVGFMKRHSDYHVTIQHRVDPIRWARAWR